MYKINQLHHSESINIITTLQVIHILIVDIENDYCVLSGVHEHHEGAYNFITTVRKLQLYVFSYMFFHIWI